MARVSVPCSCGARISYGDDSCPGCGKTVPKELNRALEERLEASSEEYREAKTRVLHGSAAAAALAGVSLVVGLLPSSPGLPNLATTQGILLLVLVMLARRRPFLGMLLALAVSLGGYLIGAVLDPAAFFAGFASFGGFASHFFRLGMILLLVFGTRGGWALRQLQKAEAAA